MTYLSIIGAKLVMTQCETGILLKPMYPALRLRAAARSAMFIATGESTAHRRNGPHLRFRLHPAPPESRQGPRPDPDFGLLVRFPQDLTPNHFLTAAVDDYPEPLRRFRGQLDGRSMRVKRARMIEIECVARGYLSGSGWKEYQKSGTVCGIALPRGLKESSQLPEPIFTPATKAQSGHDENISFETSSASSAATSRANCAIVRSRSTERRPPMPPAGGIIIADTKFEFGFVGDQLVLADEVLTPDSSRFWPEDTYKPGGPSRPTISSTCAIISSRSTGTSSRPRRACPPR